MRYKYYFYNCPRCQREHAVPFVKSVIPDEERFVGKGKEHNRYPQGTPSKKETTVLG